VSENNGMITGVYYQFFHHSVQHLTRMCAFDEKSGSSIFDLLWLTGIEDPFDRAFLGFLIKFKISLASQERERVLHCTQHLSSPEKKIQEKNWKAVRSARE
jgi:hypothetical protein